MSYDIVASGPSGRTCLHDTAPEPTKQCGYVTSEASYRDKVRLVARVIQAVAKKKVDDMDTDDGGLDVSVKSRTARFRGRNSASQTVIVEAIFKVMCDENFKIPVKTVFKWYRQNDAEVLLEAESYSCIVDAFDLPFFAFPFCVAVPGETPNNFKMEDEVRSRFGVTKEESLGFIMSENCGPKTLAQYVMETAEYRPFDREFYSAIVQVCIALEEMAKNRVVHHDMHFGNVMFPESRYIVQNVGTNTKMYLAAKKNFLWNPDISTTPVWVLTKDNGYVRDTPNFNEDAVFEIDKMVKIYDWDWIETEVPVGDRKLYHDKIGFLRNLVSVGFPIRVVVGSDLAERLDVVLKKTEYRRLVNGNIVTYAQKSEMNALSANEVDPMKRIIDETIVKLTSYAFLACLYYDLYPYDEGEVFGEGPVPRDPDSVSEKLRSLAILPN